MSVDYFNRQDCTKRYVARRACGKTGWADENSYRMKEKRIGDFLSRNPLARGSRVLELGCGAGNTTLFIAEKGFDAYGVDAEAVAIEWAKEKMKASNTRATFSVGNIVDLDGFADNFFDFVYDGETLHCIVGEDHKSCLANVFRILKPGGLFLAGANLINEELNEPIELEKGVRFDPRSQCLYHGDVAYYYLSRQQQFLEEVRQASFQVLHIEKTPQIDEYASFSNGWLWVDTIKP